MRAVVYGPPGPGLPYLAVILNSENEVVSARAVPSVAAGEALIAKTVAEFNAAKDAGRVK